MTKRILLVEDDRAVRETLERTIARWGYDVTVAASAEEALSLLQRVDPDLLITDVRMGGLSGLELLDLVRERAPEVDVIVITAFEEMQTAVRAMRAGAFEYLVKPLDLDLIEVVLQRCFADRALRRRSRQAAADAAAPFALGQLTGTSPEMIDIYKTIGRLSRTSAPVLIRGETGTGKELIARAIHFSSTNADEPFVAVNCTAIPEPLLESELFGHRKGAFTGATADRRGRFAIAGNGTVFLDEIGDTTPAFQAKLLRVLQEGEFTPVGAERPEHTTARVVAATHRDLESLVATGGFREDLYFRLRIVEIRVPPLRERRVDIPQLVDRLAAKAAASLHLQRLTVTPDALRAMSEYDWPGNVRELENTLTRAVVLSRGGVVDIGDLSLGFARTGATSQADAPRPVTLRDVERLHVAETLRRTNGNKRRAARLLGISRARLDRILTKHHLDGVVPEPTDGLAGAETRPRTE